MIRKNIWTRALIGFLALVLAAPVGVFAQPATNNPNDEGNSAPQSFSKPQLDQMLASIALYPDSLLAQVLIASTYPSQVVVANRWVKAHRGWSKARINAALDRKNWDMSVKALVPFPKVLAMMDKHLDWTTNLGEAFLGQQQEVMASVQELRQKAYAQGNLKTTEQQEVVVQRNDIEIEPVNPEVVHVPYYNPLEVYGDWWWPGYPPYAFFPYAGPYITYGLFGFAAAIGVGAYWNWGWGHWGWGNGNVYVNANRNLNINNPRAGINHRTMRTANFNTFRTHQAAGLGRAPGAHAGVFNRPSAASVRRGLSGTHAGAVSRHGVAGGFQYHNFSGGSNFRGHNFNGSNPGHFTAPGFAGHGAGGFRGSVGGASHFGGGGGFGGGAPHFGGGGGFGGGGFGGGHFGGGHFGGGGFGGGGHGGGHR